MTWLLHLNSDFFITDFVCDTIPDLSTLWSKQKIPANRCIQVFLKNGSS